MIEIKTLLTTTVVLVALEHLWFLVLEMFLWTRPIGLKTFRNTLEKAQQRRQRYQMSVTVAVEDPLLTPAVPAFHEVDVLPELGMKRVRDPHRGGHLIGARCS